MKNMNAVLKTPTGRGKRQSVRGSDGNFLNTLKSSGKQEGISITIEAPQYQVDVQSTLDRIASAMEVCLETLPPLELEQFANHLETTVHKSKNSQPETLIGSLLNDINEDEEKSLEFAALHDYFEWRQDLLKDALTAPQVAKLLNTSRQTPHDRLKKNTLIAVQDNGVWKFPVWQFDASGADGVIPGLPEVLKVLNVPALSKISWLTKPNRAFDGDSPVDALKNNRKDKVVCEARTVGIF
jgi:hypothetical protein